MYEDFLPERLAQLRGAKGISARDMSLSIGQSENYINAIENKKSLPSMAVFFYICEFLDVTPSEFFDKENRSPEKMRAVAKDLKQLPDRTFNLVVELIADMAHRKT